MASHRRLTTLGILAILAATTSLAMVWLHWRTVLEEWYLFRLESADSAAYGAAREGLIGLSSLKALPRFLKGSEGDSGPDGEGARRIIERLDPDAMSELAALLLHEEDRYYLEVVRLHKTFAADPAALARFLKTALRHPSPWIRRYAAEELSVLGTNGSIALEDLEKATGDVSEDVRFWAGVALESISESSSPSAGR